MACHSPLKAYRRPFGGVTFSQAEGTVPVNLPCGQCMGCRLDHAQQWAIRAVHESMMHEQNQFLTLTYSSEHLPKDLSLNHKHYQDFMKRYRFHLGKSIRFLMCGEYGPTGERPHYHALIFGHEFADKTLWKDGKSKLYRSPTLEKLWPFGFSTIGEVNYKTASYVAGYIRKKQKGKIAKEINPDTGLKAYELYNDDGEIIKRVPEYAQMSRRPGLGHDFYETYGDQIRNHDTVVLNGNQLRVPKYYDRLTEKLSRNVYERNKERRINRAKKHARNNTPERLAAREAYKLAVINKSQKRTEL